MGKVVTFVVLFVTLWMVFTTINIPQTGELEEISRQTFELINQERKAEGITPLIWDDSIAMLAATHSQYMADSGIFKHSDYNFTENIAEGAASNAEELYNLWRSSPAHHRNYMNRSLQYGAIGIAYRLTNVSIGSINITIDMSKGYSTFIAR